MTRVTDFVTDCVTDMSRLFPRVFNRVTDVTRFSRDEGYNAQARGERQPEKLVTSVTSVTPDDGEGVKP
jgi:hypothetical protein